MLAHFRHFAVFSSYVFAIVIGFFVFRLPPSAAVPVTVGIGVVLVAVDYVVHRSVHKWERLRYPVESILWVAATAVVLITGLVSQGWQVSGIFFVQAWWDNSWHAAYNHREEGEPKAELDSPLIRWGAAVVAVSLVMIPQWL